MMKFHMTCKLSFVGDLQINEWKGRKKPQFMIQDVKTNEWQLFDYSWNTSSELAGYRRFQLNKLFL